MKLNKQQDKQLRRYCTDSSSIPYTVNEDSSIFTVGHIVISYERYEQIPFTFFYIGKDIMIRHCHLLKTLKGLVKDFGGKLIIFDCPLLQDREIEIMNDNRLRKLWNHSPLNLDDFYSKHHGIISSKKFGF
jgi:hypothetical protein